MKNTLTTQSLTRSLALFVSLTAVLMVSNAAWDRGGNLFDRVLLVALSIALCLGAHLIPALSKGVLSWLLWTGCLFGTAYSQLVFMTHSSLRAGEIRGHYSVQVTGIDRQMQAVEKALAEVQARPIATVAAELAKAQTPRERGALRAELAEGQRAARLLDERIRLSGAAVTAEVTESADPVTTLLQRVTGSNEASIKLVMGMGFALLLELLGAKLWFESLQKQAAIVTQADLPEAEKVDALGALQAAIDAGECKPTVAGIREYLNVGTVRAQELNRLVIKPAREGVAA